MYLLGLVLFLCCDFMCCFVCFLIWYLRHFLLGKRVLLAKGLSWQKSHPATIRTAISECVCCIVLKYYKKRMNYFKINAKHDFYHCFGFWVGVYLS